ncbi:hypothetical protein MSG28_006133 [Choristoneura fumiferana]|uniref:Uncharacterized protein n=1 Tax=Choristoneura fumiferana TaxID=7141 RepID=A0ACC0JDT6_CHOFU|nr:hypothetical protein MSG28_006133 [Choristoneura fumiferana]
MKEIIVNSLTNLRSNSMILKFQINFGPAWELQPKPSKSERRPVPNSGSYIGRDDQVHCSPESIKNLLASSFILICIYSCCSYGQDLTDASLDVANAAYEGPWHLMSHEYRLCILFIMLSGNGQGTLLAGLMADGVKRFSNGVRGPGDELSVGLQQDGATTWLRSRDRGGCGKHKTGLSGEPWGGLCPAVDILNVTWSFLSLIDKVYED